MNQPDLMIKKVANGYVITNMHINHYRGESAYTVFQSIRHVMNYIHKYYEPDTKVVSNYDKKRQNSEYEKWANEIKKPFNQQNPKEGI